MPTIEIYIIKPAYNKVHDRTYNRANNRVQNKAYNSLHNNSNTYDRICTQQNLHMIEFAHNRICTLEPIKQNLYIATHMMEIA